MESGKHTANHPQFQSQSVMKMVATQLDGIVALKLDRVAHSYCDVLTLMEDILQPQNNALVWLDLNVDISTTTDKMILTMITAVV